MFNNHRQKSFIKEEDDVSKEDVNFGQNSILKCNDAAHHARVTNNCHFFSELEGVALLFAAVTCKTELVRFSEGKWVHQ